VSTVGKIKRFRRFIVELRKSAWNALVSLTRSNASIDSDVGLFEIEILKAGSQELNYCRHPRITAMILSQNGEKLLQVLFESLVRYEYCQNVEFLVSTQDSDDNSTSLIEQYSEYIEIRSVHPGFNLSFSSGINQLSRLARGELLLLLNNDFEFVRPVLCEVGNYFFEKEVGACGIPLRNSKGLLNQCGINFRFDNSSNGIRPFNMMNAANPREVKRVPGVTGAFLMTRKSDFVALEGLDENFYFGFEDVDYCIRLIGDLGKSVYLIGGLEGRHPDQTTRSQMPRSTRATTRARNFSTLQEKHGQFLRNAIRGNSQPLLVPKQPSITISGTGKRRSSRYGDSIVGDFLDRHLSERGFLVRRRDWRAGLQSTSGSNFTLHLVAKSMRLIGSDASEGSVPMAWVRQWSEIWAKDYRFLAVHWIGYSGNRFSETLVRLENHYKSKFLHLGADPKIHPLRPIKTTRDIDFLWTGNYHGVERAPQNLPPLRGLRGIAVGSGWRRSRLPAFSIRPRTDAAQIWRLYGRAKTVIDDSGKNTLPEASLNMRFWEALSAGALPLTNNRLAVEHLFPFEIPTWETEDELAELIHYWSGRESERNDLVRRIRHHIRPSAGLEAASVGIEQFIRTAERLPRICFLNPAHLKVEGHWGDTFLLHEFGEFFQRSGFVVRILPKDYWKTLGRLEAEIVVTLHGREISQLFPGQVNVLWIVSNPDRLTQDYVKSFDEIWVASERGRSLLRENFGVDSALVLPGAAPIFRQATDPLTFDHRDSTPLIIGNTLGRVRPSVIGLIEAGIPIEVIGEGWHGRIPKHLILGTAISRIEAARLYGSRRVVISDTHFAMRDWAIFPPRVYEAIAAGAIPISDVVDQSSRFGKSVPQWETRDQLIELVETYSADRTAWNKKSEELFGLKEKFTSLEQASLTAIASLKRYIT